MMACNLFSLNQSVSFQQGKAPLITVDGLHQLHILIFFLAVLHVVYSAVTMALGRLKVRSFIYSQSFYCSIANFMPSLYECHSLVETRQ